MTDGGDAVDDVGAIDGRSIPGIGGNVDSFGADFGVT